MLFELEELAERFKLEGKLAPPNYKLKTPSWFLVLDERSQRFSLEGPYEKRDYSSGVDGVYAPDCQRSGRLPRPFLLVDTAEYVFGIPDPSKAERSKGLHDEYLKLLGIAYVATKKPFFKAILEYLTSVDNSSIQALKTGKARALKPKDLIAFKVGMVDPCSDSDVISFWNEYLEKNRAGNEAVCLVCGKTKRIVKTLPREAVIMGQKCGISTFNKSPFISHGREQTENAPICFLCASSLVDVIDYLTRSPRAEKHRKVIVLDRNHPLQNQLAVFWLKERLEAPNSNDAKKSIEMEEVIGAMLSMDASEGPPTSLSQLESLLSVPWTGSEHSLEVSGNRFYLALLSANKGRMVLREWLDASMDVLKQNLKRYINGMKIIDPYGKYARAFSVPEIINSLGIKDPNLVRKLIRNAFKGLPPPQSLLNKALQELHNPAIFNLSKTAEVKKLHAMMAALKHVLFSEEDDKELMLMGSLNPQKKETAYLCGRLLSVLEEAQKRASATKLNRTLVDSFYAAASSAPSAYLGLLLNRAHSSHLPKLSKEGKGYLQISGLLENVLSRIEETGGFPATLQPKEQAEFALGFYHQRAEFRRGRAMRTDKVPQGAESSLSAVSGGE